MCSTGRPRGKRANTLGFQSAVELGVSVLIADKCFVPHGRAIFLIDDLKRPSLLCAGNSIYLHMDRNSLARHFPAKR